MTTLLIERETATPVAPVSGTSSVIVAYWEEAERLAGLRRRQTGSRPLWAETPGERSREVEFSYD